MYNSFIQLTYIQHIHKLDDLVCTVHDDMVQYVHTSGNYKYRLPCDGHVRIRLLTAVWRTAYLKGGLSTERKSTACLVVGKVLR